MNRRDGWPSTVNSRRSRKRRTRSRRGDNGAALSADRFGLPEAGEDVAVERRVLPPGWRRHDVAVTHAFRGDETGAASLGLSPDVLVTGHPLGLQQAGRSEQLDAMADGKDPFPGG